MTGYKQLTLGAMGVVVSVGLLRLTVGKVREESKRRREEGMYK